MSELPSYDDLPALDEGGRSGWGLFGEGDNLGLVNLMTPERIAAAAGLARRGAVFSLDYPLDAFSPPIVRSRQAPRHTVIHEHGTQMFDDVLDNFYPQASSQWDSLAHYGYAPNTFYNGVTVAQIRAAERNTIGHWVTHGLAGRAVVLDMVRSLAAVGRGYDPGTGAAFTVADLEVARQFANVEYKVGDIALLHTGFAEWYLAQPAADQTKTPRDYEAPGLAQEEDVLRYLWNAGIASVAADNIAVEVSPRVRTSPFGGLHRHLIGQLGMAIGELWKLDALAADCERDKVYEAFFVSAPIHVPAGIGSPANAVAIK